MQNQESYGLGIGISTQSLSAALINLASREVVCCFSRNYGDIVRTYGAVNGVLPNADPTVQHSNPRMWTDALDWVFGELVRQQRPLHRVSAIAVNSQQHATVNLAPGYSAVLQALNTPGSITSLTEALDGCFSRQTSPVWLDASTSDEAAFLEQHIGGARMAVLTGSRPALRFPALQIRRFARLEPDDYANTVSIQILSAFLASLLAGRFVPNDWGDSSGSNLMHPETKLWVDEVAAATVAGLPDDSAGGLLQRLGGSPVSPTVPVGAIAPYFAQKYGVNPDALIMPGTGDNPDGAIGTGLVEAGLFTLSLGTSYVLTGISPAPTINPDGYGHLFISGAGQYMPLLCFANGALTFENTVRFFGLTRADGKIDWPAVGNMLRSVPPAAEGGIILPWIVPEITPLVLKPGLRHAGSRTLSIPAFLRRIVEGQALAMRRHSGWMGNPTQLRATGGASVDSAVLQIYADVFGAEIVRSDSSNGAVIGSALRAALGAWNVQPEEEKWRALVAQVTAPAAGSTIMPDTEATAIYRRMLPDYGDAETKALEPVQASS